MQCRAGTGRRNRFPPDSDVPRFSEILAIIDLVELRATPGGDQLSAEMLLILALIFFDGYQLFPGPDER